MFAVSLLPSLRDHRRALVLVGALAIVLVCLALLAYAALLGAATVDSSPADPRHLAPFRWGRSPAA